MNPVLRPVRLLGDECIEVDFVIPVVLKSPSGFILCQSGNIVENNRRLTKCVHSEPNQCTVYINLPYTKRLIRLSEVVVLLLIVSVFQSDGMIGPRTEKRRAGEEAKEETVVR